jgi:hypothetical protein
MAAAFEAQEKGLYPFLRGALRVAWAADSPAAIFSDDPVPLGG